MTARLAPTNATSSGVRLDPKVIKSLRRRKNGPGLVFLLQWGLVLTSTGWLVWSAMGTEWVWLAMLVHGGMLTLPAYALSHETAHGTAYRARWLNETVLWFSSILYMEEPLHRRYTHTNHHTYTWHQNLDSQMPFDLPMTLRIWVLEIAGLSYLASESGQPDAFRPADDLTHLGSRDRRFISASLSYRATGTNGLCAVFTHDP